MAALKVGIIGAGNRSVGGIVPFLNEMEELELVAVADESNDRLELARRASRGSLRAFSDYRELVESDDVEAVIVATPSLLHADACIAALRAGKPVYCEKPVATTIPECDRIVAESARTGVPVMVGLQLRYAELYRRIEELVAAGAIGPLRMMWCKEFREPFRPGWREWRLAAASSGGSLLEKNCHHFDLFAWFAAAPTVRVAGFGGSDSIYRETDIVDNAWVISEHANGVKASLGLCLFSPFGNDLEIGLVGDRGKLESYFRRGELVVQRVDRDERTSYRISAEMSHLGHCGAEVGALRAFAEMVAGGKAPMTGLAAGRESMLVSLAAELALSERRVVEVAELDTASRPSALAVGG
jgi:predicted dehydrogenase